MRFNQYLLKTADMEDIKKKKSDDFSPVLDLMKALRDFQEEVETALEDIGDEELKATFESFDSKIDDMYAALLKAAEKGIQAIRKRNGNISDPVLDTPPVETAPVESMPETPAPVATNDFKDIKNIFAPSSPAAPKSPK